MELNIKAVLSEDNKDSLHYMTSLEGSTTKITVKNMGEDIAVKEIILIQCLNPFAADTKVYGEGFSMLTQYHGTSESILPVSGFDDAIHYKLPQKSGFNTVYNMALFEIENEFCLIGFASCRKFCGEIRFNSSMLEVALNTENLALNSNESWVLEDLFIKRDNDREKLLSEFADEIEKNHPTLKFGTPPTGWCSWYCFGPDVNEDNILDNLNSIKEKGTNLKYIQIDDGYQEYMGDWLSPAESFTNGIKSLFDKIINKGFEPAIWVAPFIAQKESSVFINHPDWFVQDENGKPLASDKFTFGGWRCAPWYMLDPTNPQVYEHLRKVFYTIRNEWKCKYFKLDANMWGAMHNGIRYNLSASKVEAYRLGMKAILEGAGDDCFLLGCNAPMWPSIGTVHGNRQTGDICRDFEQFKNLATECFYRNWQNNKFWINDPDCLTIEKSKVMYNSNLTDDEFLFHATYIYASGGMVLSGDDLSQKDLKRLDILNYLLNIEHIAAKFDDTSFTIGRVLLEDKLMLCLFNWNDTDINIDVKLNGVYKINDIWRGNYLGEFKDILNITISRHAGLLLECLRDC